MMYLYQPVYEYDTDVCGKKYRTKYASLVVYETEERARERALATSNLVLKDGDTLIKITIRQLILV